MGNMIYLTKKLSQESLESVLSGDIKGIAYTGDVIEGFMFFDRFTIDLETLSIPKEKTTLLRDHNPSLVAGTSKAEIKENQIEIEGKISKKSQVGQEIIALAEDGVDWELSVGVHDGQVDENFTGEVNGKEVEGVDVLRNGILREVSIVALGADMNTSAMIMKKERKPFNKEGNGMQLTEKQWSVLACACGGSPSDKPEEIVAKMEKAKLESEEAKEKIDELEKEVEKLEEEIEELEEEIKEIKEEEEIEQRKEKIEQALGQKGLKLPKEKIDDTSKTELATNLLMDLLGDMSEGQKKIDAKFSKTFRTDSKKPGEENNLSEVELSKMAKEMVEKGEAKNFIQAISKIKGVR